MPYNAPVPWLMESSIPSIRYFTLTTLAGVPLEDPRARDVFHALMTEGPVPQILARQAENGSWSGEHSYYTPKYTSTHWSMLLLAELGADGADPRLRRGVDFMLSAALPWDKRQRIPKSRIEIECLFGNILFYAARCGMHADERAQEYIDYLSRCALEGGWRCPYNYGEPCAWGAARVLRAFAAVPPAERGPQMQAALESGLSFLLDANRLARADYPTGQGRPSKHWQSLNFPLFYQADILFVLRALADLDMLDHPGAQPALDWLAGQMKPDGTFHGASPFRQRTYSGMGAPEETHRWVTLQAHQVLRAWRG